MASINPFQGPINYTVDVQSPFEAALGGFKIGAAGAEAQAQAQVREQAKKAQTELATLFKNPNATAADYERVLPFLPKEQAAIVTQGFERKTKAQQDSDLRMGAEVYSAIKSGQPDFAIQRLTDSAAALRNSGREQDAKAAEASAGAIKINPTGAQATVALYMARLPGGTGYLEAADKALATVRAEALQPAALELAKANADKARTEAQDKVADLRIKLQNEPIEAERLIIKRDLEIAQQQEAAIKARYAEQVQVKGLDKTNWDIKNLQSQINDRSAKLNLDRQTTQATVAEKLSAIQQRLTEIPEGARKLINESATQSATSKQAATQYNDLATRIETAQGGKGRLTSASEWFASQLGQQDAWTQIRNEYTRVRNSVAIKSLPPGVATDKDIELALKGIPPETANSATLASFLRGTAKLQDIDSAINNAKTDWLSQNNGLLTRAKAPFIAGDYSAKPGETFNDFAQRIVGDVSAKYRPAAQVADDARQSRIAQIPTNQAPAVAPVQTSIEAQADAILRGVR
jgi:hypothetical protein